MGDSGGANQNATGAYDAAGGAGGDGLAGASGSVDPVGAAGENQAAGAGGGKNAPTCQALAGVEYAQHCYVDATAESLTLPQAKEACAKLAREAERPGHLLVLDTPEEQSFILKQFLDGFTDKSDAWLALTCSDIEHPDFTACYCTTCGADALLAKRKTWKWFDASSATFGWVNANPNGGGRCSALGYNPTTLTWGWVDRSCDKNTFQLSGQYPAHSYRTLCELE